MDVAVLETLNLDPKSVRPSEEDRGAGAGPAAGTGRDELTSELGLWLSGLDSFLSIRNQSFADESRVSASSRDWTKEFRLTHSTLLRCSRSAFQLAKTVKDEKAHKAEVTGSENNTEDPVTAEELYALSLVLKEAVLLNEALLRAAPLKFGEWTSWCRVLSDKFKDAAAVKKLVRFAEADAEKCLPERLRRILDKKTVSIAAQADLKAVLDRFARILKWLSAVGEMLKHDEPLKPSLLIFARVNEQIREMMGYINNRLLRFGNQDDELFSSLDGASYTASIELRKVYSYELAGLSDMRPAPAIYAKVETAYSLLNDSSQMTLVNLAQVFEPAIKAEDLFPNFKDKLKSSLALRKDLWNVLQSVQSAEKACDEFPMDLLHAQLNAFLDDSLGFLFYKDRETVERFIEEVLITSNKKDLVPILHRFGAYLETLFGQVNMRVVLADHPFEK